MFDKAIAALDDYRTQRGQALNNESRQRWSTSGVSSMKEFLALFSSKDENEEWQKLYNAKDQADVEEVKALGLKIAFLAGCRRDIRIMHAAGENDRIRMALDWDRFEYMRLAFHRMKLQALDALIKAKAKGVEVIT